MADADTTPYKVERGADGWTFVPSSIFVSVMVGGFCAGSVFLVYLSALFFRSGDLWIGAIPLLVAGYSSVLAVRAWRTRRIPIKVESGGRVTYGERELCAAGTARGVRIVDSRGSEAGDYEVRIEQADGKLVSIPSQYFAAFKSYEHARPFAGQLAKALGVQVLS